MRSGTEGGGVEGGGRKASCCPAGRTWPTPFDVRSTAHTFTDLLGQGGENSVNWYVGFRHFICAMWTRRPALLDQI